MKLSIIVPVYNVSAFIERCLNSLLDQNLALEFYEVIIINDGSTDDSLAICEKYSTKYPNVKCFTQKNSGLSAARNTGLNKASGTYVWFVDSDDSIASKSISTLIQLMEESQLDMLRFGFEHIFNNQNVVAHTPLASSERAVVNGTDFFTTYRMVPMVWAYAYRRAFLVQHDLKFLEDLLHEDEEFTPRALYYAQRVKGSGQNWYYYYENGSSIMGSFKPKSTYDRLRVLDSLSNFVADKLENNTYVEKMRYRAFVIILTILQPSNLLKHEVSAQKKILAAIKESDFYPLKRNKYIIGLKSKIYATLINIDPGMYVKFRRYIK